VRYKSNYVKGVVRDKKTGQPLRASIELINLDSKETESLVSSDSVSGSYLIVLTQGAEYALYVNKADYLFRSLNFNYSELRDYEPIVLDIELEKASEGTSAVLENIFFDVDKYELKEKSVTELKKILRFLNENPSVRIEISGHTDNTGSAAYNVQLSEKRAQSVNNYLVSQGISQSRLTPKGYGSQQPIASNDTEEGRQKNRRIQFKIVR
jgi:OOP family OmpA-OmpF porin